MPFVILRTSDREVIGTIGRSRALTADETSAGYAKHELDDSFTGTVHIGGTATLSDGKVTAITDPNALTLVQQRREIVKTWLRIGEQKPVANWGLGKNARGAADRAVAYWRWLELIGSASAVDANLTARWNIFQNEMAWKYEVWYATHNASQWSSYADDAEPSEFYVTQSDAGGLVNRDMTLSSSWKGLIDYLY